MLDSKISAGRELIYYYLDVICYASANMFIIIGAIFCINGDLWPWAGFFLSLLLFGCFDNIPENLVNSYANKPSKNFSNFMLYMTLPLLGIYTATTFYITGASVNVNFEEFNNFNNDTYTKVFADLGAFTSLGMYYGIIAGTVGHELIHRISSRRDQMIGCLLLAPIWETGISIEHIYGHHNNVATSQDTATAFRGECFYKFYLRSSLSQITSAYKLEIQRLLRKPGFKFEVQLPVIC